MRRASFLFAITWLFLACDKKSEALPEAVKSAIVEPAPPPAPPKPTAWSGSYVAKVGEVNPPANARNKVWEKDPGKDAIGEGTIDVSLDEKRNLVTGTAKGALGEMLVSGELDDDNLRANLTPKDPNADDAMTGFLVLAREGDKFEGTLRVSNREATIAREATVELQPKKD